MWAIKRVCAAAAALMMLASGALAAPQYATKEADTGEFYRKRTFDGTVIYRQSQMLTVHVPDAVMGEVLTEAGAAVAAGDTVATYFAPMDEVDIARAELALKQAQEDHDFEVAQRTMQIDEYRQQALAADDPTDARIFELNAQREEILLAQYMAGAQAELDALSAQRDAAVNSGAAKPVSAGISGIVAFATRTDAGMDIAGRELVSIFDPGSMIVRVNNSTGELKYGMKVELTLEGSGKAVVEGTVISADNVLPGSLHTGFAYVLPDEDPGTQGFSRASVSTRTVEVQDAVIVSNQAIQYSSSRPYVRVLSSDGTVHTRYVNLAMMGDNDSWIILGVQPGDKLITK